MEKKILSLFLYKNKLKFNEIEKELNVRSNKLAYHLKNLIKEGILKKEEEEYELSEASEFLIPYISEKNSTLAVVLVHLGDTENVFLCKREKRPFKGKLGLPGGRILVGESVKEASERVMKKFGIKAKFNKINSVSLEHVKKSKRKIHSFLLIFVSVTSKDKDNLLNINKNKKAIISSDYTLLKKDLNKNIKIRTVYSSS